MTGRQVSNIEVSTSKQSSPSSVLISLPQIEPFDVNFNDITYTVRLGYRGIEKKKILKKVSGQFNAGEVTTIMGPSGAGKSSLLHILTGFINDGIKGTINNSGRKVTRRGGKGDFRKEACYIMQENYLQPLLTVKELMMLSANLKLGNCLSLKAKQLLVEDTLDTLSLSSSVNTRCCKLSGGQAKRLSIALELLDNPPVMFLDEPTTGLDSVTALHCINILKALARDGRTIICTIHQPSASILEIMDQVYILNKGQCVYQGAPCNMLPYLRQFQLECPKYHNPADFMLEVLFGDHGNFDSELIEGGKTSNWKKPREINRQIHHQLNEVLRSEKDPEKVEMDKARTMVVRPPKEIDRFWILVGGFYTQLFRDWAVFHVRLALHFAVGTLIGLTFFQIGGDGSRTVDNVRYLFGMILYLSYTSLIPASVRFPVIRDILSKESFNNWYNLKTFFAAHVVANLPVQFLFTAVPISLSYVLTAQPMEWFRFVRVILIYYLSTLTAEGFGFFFGTLCRPTMSTFYGALYCAFLVLFGGMVIFFNDMPYFLYWLSFINFFAYAYDAVIAIMFSYNRRKLNCPADELVCYLVEPRKILKELGVSGNMFWLDIFALLLFVTFTRLITYFFLKRVIRKTH